MEAAERPNLASKAGSYDRFGFFIDTGAGSSLEEKAEFLRKQAENHHDELDEGALQVRKKSLGSDTFSCQFGSAFISTMFKISHKKSHFTNIASYVYFQISKNQLFVYILKTHFSCLFM